MNPTQFMPVYPCFGIFDEDCTGPVVIETMDGTKALVVLTDNDLLHRYRTEHEAVGPAIRFDSTAQLALYLDAVVRAGLVTHIGFDPGSRTAVTVAAAELYKKLLGKL